MKWMVLLILIVALSAGTFLVARVSKEPEVLEPEQSEEQTATVKSDQPKQKPVIPQPKTKPQPTPTPTPPTASGPKCQTDFTMAFLYVYEPSLHIPANLAQLERDKAEIEKFMNISGRGKVTFDLSYPVVAIPLTDQNRGRLVEEKIFQSPTGAVDELFHKELIKEFYRTHPDQFDFISVFANFNYNLPAAIFHRDVQNKIEGIGEPIYNLAITYGSAGRLLGYNLLIESINSNYDPTDTLTKLARELKSVRSCSFASITLHETVHQWAANLGDTPDKTDSDLILQSQFPAHWYPGLNIGDDPVGGVGWQDNGDGTFTVKPPARYCGPYNPDSPGTNGLPMMSDLTLYLIGAIEAEEVKPIQWIKYNHKKAFVGTITKPTEVKWITIEDIIARHGPRICRQ